MIKFTILVVFKKFMISSAYSTANSNANFSSNVFVDVWFVIQVYPKFDYLVGKETLISLVGSFKLPSIVIWGLPPFRHSVPKIWSFNHWVNPSVGSFPFLPGFFRPFLRYRPGKALVALPVLERFGTSIPVGGKGQNP